MISAQDCWVYSADCVTQRMEAHTSVECANMLMAMARNWATLADQMKQYNEYVKVVEARPSSPSAH
jgi:hypothetical protein